MYVTNYHKNVSFNCKNQLSLATVLPASGQSENCASCPLYQLDSHKAMDWHWLWHQCPVTISLTLTRHHPGHS